MAADTGTTKKDLHTLHGLIVAIQEERFRLIIPEGQGYLLTLAKSAPVSPRDLHRWRSRGITVVVRYTGQPNLESGIAWAVAAE
jgi:hypothetical protein